jgi:hypothetical protein
MVSEDKASPCSISSFISNTSKYVPFGWMNNRSRSILIVVLFAIRIGSLNLAVYQPFFEMDSVYILLSSVSCSALSLIM